MSGHVGYPLIAIDFCGAQNFVMCHLRKWWMWKETRDRAIRGQRSMTRLVADMVTEHNELIEALAAPHRATDAFRALLDIGIEALPAVRAGLRHDNPEVRLHCCRFLDRYLMPETLSDLLDMLDDGDKRLRCSALHTLACDRCKEGTCRPEEGQVLPKAINLLESDPDAHVRAMAIEVVGQFVHTNTIAAGAISHSLQYDENSTVRKKAGWYAPGGPIHKRTRPRRRKVPGSEAST